MRVDYGGYGRIAALFVAASLILGWGAAVRAQSAANAPEAHAFTPPPRSIADITAILDREKPDPAKIAEAKQRADAQPPSGASDAVRNRPSPILERRWILRNAIRRTIR